MGLVGTRHQHDPAARAAACPRARRSRCAGRPLGPRAPPAPTAPVSSPRRCPAWPSTGAPACPAGSWTSSSIAAGVAGHALLIDCATLEVDPVSRYPTDASVWVVHSGRSRRLVGSAYAERRARAEAGAESLGPLPRRRRSTTSKRWTIRSCVGALATCAPSATACWPSPKPSRRGDLATAGAADGRQPPTRCADDFEVSTDGARRAGRAPVRLDRVSTAPGSPVPASAAASSPSPIQASTCGGSVHVAGCPGGDVDDVIRPDDGIPASELRLTGPAVVSSSFALLGFELRVGEVALVVERGQLRQLVGGRELRRRRRGCGRTCGSRCPPSAW